MFGLFNRQAPAYQGDGQPQPQNCGDGLFGILSRVLSGTKPAYRGAGQSASSPAGWCGWFAGSPAYRSTPIPGLVTDPLPETPAAEPEPEPAPEPEPEPEPNGQDDRILIERGEPLLARVPVTIVIRRSPE